MDVKFCNKENIEQCIKYDDIYYIFYESQYSFYKRLRKCLLYKGSPDEWNYCKGIKLFKISKTFISYVLAVYISVLSGLLFTMIPFLTGEISNNDILVINIIYWIFFAFLFIPAIVISYIIFIIDLKTLFLIKLNPNFKNKKTICIIMDDSKIKNFTRSNIYGILAELKNTLTDFSKIKIIFYINNDIDRIFIKKIIESNDIFKNENKK